MSFVAELKRRNVFRVAAAYVVAGWLLTEVLTTVLPTVGAPEWLSRAVVLVFALGFLPTVVFAWLYQVTPDGLKKQREVDRDESLQPSTGHRLEYLTFAAVVLGVLFLAFFGSQDVPPSAPVVAAAENSVAVLPFVNLSDNPDNEYFSDGLTETLLHMLAKIPELKVAARTSSFAFKNQSRPIGEIAAALGVAHVLEGSVQRVGDRVRITAQLIRASDEFHVWSGNYDRTLDDIFAIQDEIATEVGTALSKSILGGGLAGADSAPDTEDPDAYDLYLQALKERTTFSFWGLRAEEDLLKGALTVDPDFTDAKTALAYNYLGQVTTGLMDERRARGEILALTEQALEQRPLDVNAQAIRLYLDTATESRSVSPERLQETLDKLEELVAENPENFQARMLLTKVLANFHRLDKAESVLQAARKLDPLNSRILFELGALYARQERRDEARDLLRQSLAIEPKQPNAYAVLSSIDLASGDGVAFVRNQLRAIEVDPADHEHAAVLAMFLYELGLLEEADDFRNRVRSIAPTSAVALQLEVQRALAIGDDAEVAARARLAIENDVPNRQSAFANAVIELLRIAVRNGEVEAALRFIEGQAPSIFDIDADSLPLKYRLAQFAALDAWYVVLPRDELLLRVDKMVGVLQSFGADLGDRPTMQFTILALRGETQAAIELALAEILVDSVLDHPGWRRTLAMPQYADIVADERIRAGLERWTEEESTVRERVRSYFGDLRAAG